MTSPTERFMAKVSPEPNTGCWLWAGAFGRRSGYGFFKLYRPTVAHRAAWSLFRGPIPEGQCVLHRCDNPPCVNPAHLFLGTQRDNMKDMAAKGRARSGNAKGEANGRAKLSPESVAAIRLLRGKVTQARIAAAWGVAKSLVWAIQAGRVWRSAP